MSLRTADEAVRQSRMLIVIFSCKFVNSNNFTDSVMPLHGDRREVANKPVIFCAVALF
jgi:hypothetical protein